MFDVDDLVARCTAAAGDGGSRQAVKEVLERAVREPAAVAAALPPERAEIVPLFTSETCSVLKVVWAPGMRFRPHNHRMWAAIALYAGQEDNAFYRRVTGEHGLVAAGGRELRTGDVTLLGTDAIHAVTNPRSTFTGAIHVYGGDITTRAGRSEWDDDTFAEVPYDFARTRAYFEAANATSPT
jgi:predicted metal-dependent enzyme (double-stranded beta helix superfamily)